MLLELLRVMLLRSVSGVHSDAVAASLPLPRRALLPPLLACAAGLGVVRGGAASAAVEERGSPTPAPALFAFAGGPSPKSAKTAQEVEDEDVGGGPRGHGFELPPLRAASTDYDARTVCARPREQRTAQAEILEARRLFGDEGGAGSAVVRRPWFLRPAAGGNSHRCGEGCRDTAGVLTAVAFSPLASTPDFADRDRVYCWRQSQGYSELTFFR
jgi:hypothetical protein